MTTREKIILSLTLVTAVLGFYQVFVSDPGGNKVKSHSETKEQLAHFIEQVTAQNKQTMPSITEKYVIAHSSLPWSKNPFILSLADLSAKGLKKPTARDKTGGRPRWVYSGFISFGSRKLAIINGIEYEPGELLMDKGYYLNKIFPDHIELVGIKNKDVVILPLPEKN